jgi:hypothetical protein
MRLFKREPMEFIGDKSRKAIDDFMKAFPDYEIEYVVADIQVKIPQIKGTLQIKMRKSKEQNTKVIITQPQESIKNMKAKRQTT